MQCSAVQCSAVQCSAVQCSAVQCSAVQCSAVQCSAVQCSAVQCSAVQCSAVQCSAVQCSAVQCSAVQCSAVQCSAVQCSAVQCSAVQCSAVQCSAVQCSAVQRSSCFTDRLNRMDGLNQIPYKNNFSVGNSGDNDRLITHALSVKSEYVDLVDVTTQVGAQFKCVRLKMRPSPAVCLHPDVTDKFLSKQVRREGLWEPKITRKIFQDILYNDPQLGVLDIGAHIGVYSLISAAMGHNVISVEPYVGNYERLHKAVNLGEGKADYFLLFRIFPYVRDESDVFSKSIIYELCSHFTPQDFHQPYRFPSPPICQSFKKKFSAVLPTQSTFAPFPFQFHPLDLFVLESFTSLVHRISPIVICSSSPYTKTCHTIHAYISSFPKYD